MNAILANPPTPALSAVARLRRPRHVLRLSEGLPTSDGAGVKLTRFIGTPRQGPLDPSLMLDAFGTERPQDYIAGFPSHPHRGFETVTYMLVGRMRHRAIRTLDRNICRCCSWMLTVRCCVRTPICPRRNGPRWAPSLQ